MKELNDIQRDMQIIEGKDNGLAIMQSGKALQQVKTQFTTALVVQQPRSMAKAVKSLMQEANFAGSSFYYRWPVKTKGGGQKFVQGPSIDLAMSLARNYGNCVVDVDVTETSTHYLFKGTFIDLETGFTVPRLFRQRKNQNMGSKMDADRQEDIVFQIGHSKAQRNAIIKAMPGWLVDKLIETSRNAELNNVKSQPIEVSRASVIDFFEGYGANQEMLEKKVGVQADKWLADQILEIRDMAKSLKDGQTTINDLFPKEEKDISKLGEKLENVVGKKGPTTKKTTPKKETDSNKVEKKEPVVKNEKTTLEILNEFLEPKKQAAFERKQFFDFIGSESEVEKVSSEQMMKIAISNFPIFWQTFEEHVKKLKKDNNIPGDPGENPVNPWSWEAYKNMRTAGFKPHVLSNLESFDDLHDKMKAMAIDKWNKLYPGEQFPIKKEEDRNNDVGTIKTDFDPSEHFDCPNENNMPVLGIRCIECDKLDGCPSH